MIDHVTKEKRSEIMRSVKAKNTSPELVVRKLIFNLGYRYRLHKKDLPGKPDIVFPGRRKVIYVHGCFWHFHKCKKGMPPKSNFDFWINKLISNENRDKENQLDIKRQGWEFLVIWQCEIKNADLLKEKLIDFLKDATLVRRK